MTAALAVARLELREWRTLPVVALAAGCLPVLLYAAGRTRWHAELTEMAYWCVSWLAFAAAALAAGASVARDLAKGRAMFLLARPISWGAIAAGKLAAASGVTLLAGVCATAPGWAFFEAGGANVDTGGVTPLDGRLGLALLFMALGHWGALAASARGRRVLADAGIVLALLLVAAREAYAWIEAGIVGFDYIVAVAISPLTSAAAGAALLLAGAARFRFGGGDPRRSYAVFSTAAIVAFASTVAVSAASRRWLTAVPAPIEMMRLDTVSPDGGWVSVAVGRDAEAFSDTASFLVRTGGGAALRQGGRFAGMTEFSADGRWAAWCHVSDGLNVLLGRLEAGAEPRVVVKLRRDYVILRLSPAGERLLLSREPGVFEAWSTSSLEIGAVLAGVDDAGFLDERTAWTLRAHGDGCELTRVDLATGRRQRWATFAGLPAARLALSDDRRHALAWTDHGKVLELRHCDLGSGACAEVALEEMSSSSPGCGAGAAFLSDAAVVVSSGCHRNANVRVRVVEANGRERWRLDTGTRGFLIGEPREGLVAIGCRPPGTRRLGVAFVETATGRVVHREERLQASLDLRAPFLRGRAATFFVADQRRLVRLNLDTWRREPVAWP